jgi:hypothetical protein
VPAPPRCRLLPLLLLRQLLLLYCPSALSQPLAITNELPTYAYHTICFEQLNKKLDVGEMGFV